MTTQGWIGSPAIAATLAIAFVFVASSCGQSTSSAKPPTASVAPSPTPAPPLPAASPPPGGPVPAPLLGDWFLLPAPSAVIAAQEASACPTPLTAQTCFFQLNLTATEYHVAFTQTPTGSGNVVVNNDEIDFFNGGNCGLQLPDGVGRYTWALAGGVLRFTLLGQDPCGRDTLFANQSWSHTV